MSQPTQQPEQPASLDVDLQVQDILAELTPRGRREWDAAQQRAINRKLLAEISALRNERSSAAKPAGT